MKSDFKITPLPFRGLTLGSFRALLDDLKSHADDCPVYVRTDNMEHIEDMPRAVTVGVCATYKDGKPVTLIYVSAKTQWGLSEVGLLPK